MIRIKQTTKQGWIECCNGGVADLSYPNSKFRRGRVQNGGIICPTITTTGGLYRIEEIMGNDNVKYYCAASRGRDPDDPGDRTAGNPNLVQRLEINWSGFSNTITSVEKDNYILEIRNNE